MFLGGTIQADFCIDQEHPMLRDPLNRRISSFPQELIRSHLNLSDRLENGQILNFRAYIIRFLAFHGLGVAVVAFLLPVV